VAQESGSINSNGKCLSGFRKSRDALELNSFLSNVYGGLFYSCPATGEKELPVTVIVKNAWSRVFPDV
jgi:hypothetical protein